ncbi:ABC-F family ATP-binding cassette domain-containing protein [Candidatus Dojkabacteria bacterium]|nr:ABC-F family ATP-binding cassette domain-containing protein [Candidatus Dojkabacteria bacterium]
MSYVLVENLTKTILDRTLLDEVGFAVEQGEKIALVAKNGTGKSTLLKILNGKENYDGGSITKQKGITWGFLEQDPNLDLDKTLKEEIFESDSPMIKAVRLYEESIQDPNDQKKMEAAHEAMNKYNAWEYEATVHEILEKLKLLHLLDKTISTFSGGQKKRVALAKVLIDNPDFLLLDEPTNHLDLEMIDWLENYFIEQKITLLLVTHDRYFLDRVCNQILEIDKGKIYKHKGNYSYYLEKKGIRQLNENVDIDKVRAFLKKEKVWVDRQPQGRQGKASARVDAYYKLKEQVDSKVRNVTKTINLDIVGRRVGGKILELHNLNKSFGNKKILKDFTYSFTKGEKIGIIGKNGVGKSTFLNIIMESETADSGKIVKGETINFGYYSQHQEELNGTEKIIDSVKKVAHYVKLSDGTEVSASKMLERFLFTPNSQQNFVGKLSGGEKKRLSLLMILMRNPNFLILDEPTNDFDLMTLEVLEEFLREFKGCLLIISHDRYFLDGIVDHLFIFQGDGIIQNFPGNYSDYRTSLENPVEEVLIEEIIEEPTKPKSNPQANELYKEIVKLERKRDKLSEQIAEAGSDFEKIAELGKEIKELEFKIEEMNERWLEISV